MLLVFPSININDGAIVSFTPHLPNAMSSCSGSKRSAPDVKDIVPTVSPSFTLMSAHAPEFSPATASKRIDHLIPVIVHGKVAVISDVFTCVVVNVVAPTLTKLLSTGRRCLFSMTIGVTLARFLDACIFANRYFAVVIVVEKATTRTK